jgi:hypothetical protein
VASKFRKVTLLGAFEIQTEGEVPVRDGLILGSRREQRGFVLETSRESIEQIVAVAGTPNPSVPRRMAIAVGPLLENLGYELMRVELHPMPIPEGAEEEGYGSYVQGSLVFRHESGKYRSQRLEMTATEAILVAIATGLPMMAAYELLQLNVSHFLAEIDEMSQTQQQEAQQFHKFLDNVTATDFARFYEQRGDEPPKRADGPDGPSDDDT